LELHQDGKNAHPDELTQVSDSGKQAQLTQMQFQA
jgi:hypothetical protein